MTVGLTELAARWRKEATLLRRWGAETHSTVLECCTSELEAALRESELEAVTLREAAKESGFSYSTIQKKVASGELAERGQQAPSPSMQR